jgi:hypothetical protein
MVQRWRKDKIGVNAGCRNNESLRRVSTVFPGGERAIAGWIGLKLVPPRSPGNNISSKESGLQKDRPQRFRAYALDIFYGLKPSVDVILP